MTQLFGDFIETEGHAEEYLKIGFSPSSIPLQQRWRNNGLSADFLAGYLSTFFPGEDNDALNKQAEFKDAVSYVANELLESAMKFNYAPAHHSVSITMQLDAESVRFYVTNSIDRQTLPSFQTFIQELLAGDPDELYMERLMQNAEGESDGGSGLGFLTMLNDYHAKLGWKFEVVDKRATPTETTMTETPVTTVTTMVQLTI